MPIKSRPDALDAEKSIDTGSSCVLPKKCLFLRPITVITRGPDKHEDPVLLAPSLTAII